LAAGDREPAGAFPGDVAHGSVTWGRHTVVNIWGNIVSASWLFA
jgi:hypothetical protein